MKTVITLEKRNIKPLMELLERGLAYSDMFYNDGRRMEKIHDKVLQEIKTRK